MPLHLVVGSLIGYLHGMQSFLYKPGILTHPVTVQDYTSQLQPVIDVYGIGLAVIEELGKSAISGPQPTT